MEGSNAHIRNIIHKYISGEYTLEEFRHFTAYIQQSDIDDFDEEAWLVWEKILQNNARPGDDEAATSGMRAMQIIRQQWVEPKNEPEKKGTIGKVLLRFAAAIVLLVSVSISFYLLISVKNEPSVIYATVTANRGQKKEMQLVDGSAIHLNSESRISYPELFIGNTREVSLTGEAFFDIAHDSLHAFVVNTSGIVVKVLGTSFNIKNYETDSIMTITVSTGKVEVITAEHQVYLLPDEQLNIDKGTGEIVRHHVNADKYSLWRKGMLFFDHTPIAEALKTLERWYNTDICIEEDCKVLISGEHDNMSLRAVLEAICFTSGLKYKNESNCITLH